MNGRKLKIAQIAPLAERVPPKKYGGTERVVATLTDGLVKRGHDVTLFATGDSITSAKLMSVYPKALREAKIRRQYALENFNDQKIVATYEDIYLRLVGKVAIREKALSPFLIKIPGQQRLVLNL